MSDSVKEGPAAVLEKIEAMGRYREVGMRLHEIIVQSAPHLEPRLWYGMPGYAKGRRSPVICFFRADDYLTFGLTEKAHLSLDADASDRLIESAWFLTELDEATEARIADIVTKAAR